MTIPFSLRWQLEWIASWTRMILSRIFLPLMKPPWFSGIILGRIILRLVAIILVISLYPVFHNEIGLNRLNVEAPFSFRIKAWKGELVLPPNLLTSWEYLIIFKRSNLIIGQQQVKNRVVKPLGPWVLSGFIIDKTTFSSFMVRGAIRKLFSSGLIRGGMRSNGWDRVSKGASMGAMNKSLKVDTAAYFMSSKSLSRAPWKFISETALKFFRASACLWKYLVFLSPLKSQRLQDFCRQYSSSNLQAEKKAF